MRVLQINKFFHPRAGAETAFMLTRDLLLDEGHEVIDFAMRHPNNISSPYDEFFAPARSYGDGGGADRRLRDALASVYSLQARRALRRLLDTHRPDVAHLHNIYHQLTLSIVDELLVQRVPIVLTIHDWKIACPAYTLYTEGAPCRRCPGGSVMNAVRHRCVKHSVAASTLAAAEAMLARRRGTYQKVHRVVAPSRFGVAMAELAGINPDRVEYIPNFLPDAELTDRPTARDHGPRLVYAGRLDETKGIRPMLAAFAMVGCPASLRIAGSGELEDEVLSAAARDDRIKYLGRLSREECYEEFEQARAVVLPSLYEDNGPFVILEAQARAAAMIVTNRGGPPEFVRTEETGLVVDPGDVEQLAAAMDRMATDATAARAWGDRAQQQVREEHSARRHYRELSRVYAAAIAELR
jgi:glycosyltransferase involved in cell wall biosynthesis